MRNLLPKGLSALALLTVASSALVGQESTGQIVGTVKAKSTKAGLEGVKVTLTSPALQGPRVLVTDANGSFRAPLLPPGTYRIQTQKDGFSSAPVTSDLRLAQVLRLDLNMDQAGAAAIVEVVAAGGIVDKTDVKTSTSLTSETFDSLPRTSRDLNTAALMAPGVNSGGFTDGGRVAIRGSQGFGSRFLLNGTDISDNVFGGTTGTAFFVDDSIEETQVIQSPINSRYGNFTGGVINAITKTGSNDFTGVFRANLSRTSWAAKAPRGPWAPYAEGGNNGTEGVDALNRAYTLWLGGPIIKDKLWFAVSTKLNPPAVGFGTFTSVPVGTVNTDGSPTYISPNQNTQFPTQTITTFYEAKVTWAITQEHSLEVAGNKNVADQQNRFYVNSADPRTLIPQTNESSYWTVGYRGIWSNSLNFEGRIAKKHQMLGAGADPTQGETIFVNLGNGPGYLTVNNGIFNGADGGDNRDIITANGNLQWISPASALGTHILDVGFEYLEQKRSAANDQAPLSRDFNVDGQNPDGTFILDPTSFSSYISYYMTDRSATKSKVSSFYVNDLWSITDQVQVSLGLRHDKTDVADTKGVPTIKVSSTSPRFQVKVDPFKDQSYIFSASFAEYVGRLQDGFTNRFSLAGNPVTEQFLYSGPYNAHATLADVSNLANYSLNLATTGTLVGLDSPLNRSVNPKIKPPKAVETSVGIRRNFRDGSFVNVNYTQRKYKDAYNDFFTSGQANSEIAVASMKAAGHDTVNAIREYWDNDPRMTRDYKSLELEFASKISPRFNIGGNWTYSLLKGNSTGSEGGNPPVPGDPIGNYDATHQAYGRGLDFYAPYGYLPGDQRNRMRISGTWTERAASGALFEASLLFNYTAGGTIDLTRANRLETRADETTAGNPSADLYPRSYTRYYAGRGFGTTNDIYNFDLKVRTEIPIAKKLRYFAEVTVFNVFNNWQVSTFSTNSRSGQLAASGANAFVATNNPLSGFYGSAVSNSAAGNKSGFGTYNWTNYTGGRSIALSTGLKW